MLKVLGIGVLLPFALAAAGGAVGVLLASVRSPTLAGTWYPGDERTLKQQVSQFLEGGSPLAARPLAIIAPHAGYVFSGRCAGMAYAAARGHTYKRVVILAPSHYTGFPGMALPKATAFATPLGEAPVDTEAVARLAKSPPFSIFPAAHAREHAVEIQVPFVQVACRGAAIVPVVVGSVSESDISRAAAALAGLLDEETLLVASSDFTHHGPRYGFVLEGKPEEAVPELDRGAIDLILKRDWRGLLSYVEETGATICGAYPIATVLAALPEGTEGRLLEYCTSADVTGDWDNTVSYAAIAFTAAGPQVGSRAEQTAVAEPEEGDKGGLSEEEKRILLQIARRTLEAHLSGEPIPDFAREFEMTPALLEKRGAFVTLIPREGTECQRRFGNLRGCIGYVQPAKPLWEAVRDNAMSASTHDPRFPPMSLEEADQVRIEISAMSPLSPCEDPESIVVGKHGLLVSKGLRSGLLLPQVPVEFGWGREEFLEHTCMKAGLPPDAWKKGARLETFTAEVFGEEH